MSEFNNRITAQRKALKIVNASGLFSEDLLGLTEKAIDRWSKNNNVDSYNNVIKSLKHLSNTLFFLANKSQEQVSEDYKILSVEVEKQLSDLKMEIDSELFKSSYNNRLTLK